MCSRWSCSGCGYQESLRIRPECVEQECPRYKIPGSERRKTSVIFPFFSSKLWLTTWTFSLGPGAAMFSVGGLLLPLLNGAPPGKLKLQHWCKVQSVLLRFAKLPSVFQKTVFWAVTLGLVGQLYYLENVSMVHAIVIKYLKNQL